MGKQRDAGQIAHNPPPATCIEVVKARLAHAIQVVTTEVDRRLRHNRFKLAIEIGEVVIPAFKAYL